MKNISKLVLAVLIGLGTAAIVPAVHAETECCWGEYDNAALEPGQYGRFESRPTATDDYDSAAGQEDNVPYWWRDMARPEEDNVPYWWREMARPQEDNVPYWWRDMARADEEDVQTMLSYR